MLLRNIPYKPAIVLSSTYAAMQTDYDHKISSYTTMKVCNAC